MNCCNVEHKNKDTTFVCPRCQEGGILVNLATPENLLKESVKTQLRLNHVYKFCKNSSCSISYFTEDKSHYFAVEDLKEKATLKDKGMDVKVCYCFGHTRQSVLSELQSAQKSTVIENIKLNMKNPGCFCEVSNPQGGCCLGNVAAWIKEARLLLGVKANQTCK